MGERDWHAWHEPYDRQGSSLARRLEIVQRRLVDAIGRMVFGLTRLCRRGSTVSWTRHRRPPGLTPRIRAWFSEAGFEEVAFDCEAGFLFGIGTPRFVADPWPFRSATRLFDFVGD